MSKKSPQNAILKILAKKKAVSVEELKAEASHNQELGTVPEISSQNDKYAISRAIKNLLDSGLAEQLESDQKEYLRLTPAGKKKLVSSELSSGTIPVPAVWDGLWRIIILDIPEERKNEREALRYLLKKAGFACVKNTVWVSPYPFEHLFTNIKKDLGLSTELMIITTDSIDEDTRKFYLKIFGKEK